MKELERENEALRKKVNALESRLDRVVEQDDAPQQPRRRSKKAPATAAELRSQVTQLQKQVGRLEKVVAFITISRNEPDQLIRCNRPSRRRSTERECIK